MSQMRAVLIRDGKGPAENLYIGKAPKPTPNANQVLVKLTFQSIYCAHLSVVPSPAMRNRTTGGRHELIVDRPLKIKAFGLNRMDIHQRLGHYPPPAGSSTILGVEFSGHIAQLGTAVNSGWKVGDEVMGLAGGGAYAEFIVLPHTHIMPKPAHLSWVEAACVPECFITAYQALVRYGEVKKGEDVLVHAGASGVGLAVIHLARLYGAHSIIATASSKEKLDFLLSLPNGATHGVNYRTQDFASEAKNITNKGVDVVIDFVGQSHWTKNIDAMALDGRMTMLATLSGSTVESFDLRPILYKRLRIQGSTLRSRSESYQADLIQRFSKDVVPHITGEKGDGPVKVYIHKVYSWTEIQEAHKEMESNQNLGKIVSVID
ncbi:quinone oxidoreductase [Pleurotus eryngii]|uniref:Quinone oxidoreductase n=1 Tax=Pleurotus eryngii TaxID=5323 RepID=A0A9P6DAA8_PLEER|nr:quinone oxidoreductase [Pleurotus eryngii]